MNEAGGHPLRGERSEPFDHLVQQDHRRFIAPRCVGGRRRAGELRLRTALDQVEQSKKLNQAILDSSPSVIYLKGLDGRYLFVNIQTPGVTFAITGPWAKGSL